jgi:hypothetical protein
MKLPDDGSDETKHAARCCMALKGRVGRYTSFVFQEGLQLYRNNNNNIYLTAVGLSPGGSGF